VDSSLVTIDRRAIPTGEEGPFLRRVIDAAFSQRRKLLANSLSSSLSRPKTDVVATLEGLGVAPSARAEQLEPLVFLELARRLKLPDLE
jgi:16S rRNA (adenine1518-N6/adenine1519-N6)-dimethyltransferase